MVDAVQWIALGLAMSNGEFAIRLCREVGPNAFDGFARIIYDQIEQGPGPRTRDLLGIDTDGKLSGAILKFLASEAGRAWNVRNGQIGKAADAVETIKRSLATLLGMARHDKEKVEFAAIPDEFVGGDGI